MDALTIIQQLPPFVLAAIAYVVILCLAAAMHAYEGRLSPVKRARYKALPLRFKLGCLLGVCPLFALSMVYGWLVIFGWLAWILVEQRAVRWYEANGLL